MALVIIRDSFHNLAKTNLAKRRPAWRKRRPTWRSEGQFGEGQLGEAKANLGKRRPTWGSEGQLGEDVFRRHSIGC